MKMNDFVASCLGMDGGVLDELCEYEDWLDADTLIEELKLDKEGGA